MAAGLDDIATNLQQSNQLMRQLISVISGLFPRATGTFTMAAAATKTVTDGNVTTSSYIPPPTPTNAAAATLIGSAKSLYVTTASGSFVVTTANGVAAAGTETFQYAVFNPL